MCMCKTVNNEVATNLQREMGTNVQFNFLGSLRLLLLGIETLLNFPHVLQDRFIALLVGKIHFRDPFRGKESCD